MDSESEPWVIAVLSMSSWEKALIGVVQKLDEFPSRYQRSALARSDGVIVAMVVIVVDRWVTGRPVLSHTVALVSSLLVSVGFLFLLLLFFFHAGRFSCSPRVFVGR